MTLLLVLRERTQEVLSVENRTSLIDARSGEREQTSVLALGPSTEEVRKAAG